MSLVPTSALFLCAVLFCTLYLSTLCGCDYYSAAALWTPRSLAGQSATSDPLLIQLTGTEHRWKIEYLSSDQLSNQRVVASIEGMPTGYDLHVPVRTNVEIVLKSNDYLYTLAIPELGLKEIAVPALEFRMSFRPDEPGTFSLVGEELCEAPEGLGMGRLIVEPRADFVSWLRSQNTSL